MTETYGPFDGVPWSQAQWFGFASAWAPSGVISAPAASVGAGGLPLTINGLTVSLGVGSAWVHGAGYTNDAVKAFTVAANTNASLSRRDRIVLRRDLAAKTVTAIRLTGTAASTPLPPALTQVEGGQWDFPLFSFLVPPNSGTTLTGIIDEREWVSTDGGRGGAAPALTACTPAGGWSSPPGRGQQVYLDASGLVRLTGWIQNDAQFIPAGQTMLTIPQPFWPAAVHHFTVPLLQEAIHCICSVQTDGRVVAETAVSVIQPAHYWDLSAIFFHPTSTA